MLLNQGLALAKSIGHSACCAVFLSDLLALKLSCMPPPPPSNWICSPHADRAHTRHLIHHQRSKCHLLSTKFHWIFSAARLHSAGQHWIDMRYEHCAILGVGHEWQCLSCIKRPKSKPWELSTTLKINNVGQKLRVVA
jgi:hypothetical protein